MNPRTLSRHIALLILPIFVVACAAISQPATSPAKTPTLTPTLQPDYTWTDESPAPDKFSIIVINKGAIRLSDVLQQEAEKATELNRKPFIEFSADWCPPCNAITESMGDPLMIDAFSGTYIIKLDIDQWQHNVAEIDLYVPGIPAFYEIDSEGYPTGRMVTGAAWGEDIPANIAPPLKVFFNGK